MPNEEIPTSVKLSKYTPYFLILPTLAYMIFFIGYPLVQGIMLAFFDEQGRFTLENVNYLLYGPGSLFWDALKYTILLAAVIIPIQVSIAFGLALLFNLRFPGKNAALYTVILPLTISDVAAGLIWYVMLGQYGFFNKILMNLGIISHPIIFFGIKDMEFIAIVITEIWRATAIVFIIIYAGLQMISHEYYEAAEVFGATTWQRFRYIVFPLLLPSLQAALIIRTLFAFQIFGVVWTLAGRDIPVLAGEAYYAQTELLRPGVASLYALIIAGLSIAVGALYIKFFKAKYLEAGM
ncbi:MAG TPA: sugar ABC transporter permease [Desulfurococcaceae archaeon]|nr:MAG: sugar ABC transporter permease [Thermoprotei archaeon]HDJ83473.1 sugar ABC transporter permease [Desulfurococcaceae archaeon]